VSPIVLRTLLVLLAVLGAMTSPGPGAAGAEVGRGQLARPTSPHAGPGSDQDSGWPGLAALSASAPVTLAGSEKPGRGPCSAGEELERIPRPRPAVRALDPRRCGAFAPGERPAALAFLRMNGSANANGAGT
jgi:hypothetical protein